MPISANNPAVAGSNEGTMPATRFSLLALLVPALAMAQAGPQPAGVDGRRLEVDAALAVARADLRAQVLAVPVGPNTTLRSLSHGKQPLNIDAVLAAAQVVGQPRWIGDDIVQVAVRLPAGAFIERVRAAGIAAGLKKSEIERFARQWDGRSLQGLGQAIPASHVSAIVTTLQPAAWAGVPDAARLDAASRARQNASGTIAGQAAAIPVGPGQTAADNFTSPAARDRIAAWADTMPATRVVLTDQRELQLSVYVDKDGLGDVLKSQLSSAVTNESDKTQAINARVSAMPDLVVGRASVVMPAAPVPRAAVVFRQAPAWAGDTLTAEGTSPAANSPLHTARRAEAAARAALRQKILKLPMADATTLDQSINKDAAVNDAVAAAIDRARVYQTDYNPDGSATIRLSLDAGELIEILSTPR